MHISRPFSGIFVRPLYSHQSVDTLCCPRIRLATIQLYVRISFLMTQVQKRMANRLTVAQKWKVRSAYTKKLVHYRIIHGSNFNYLYKRKKKADSKRGSEAGRRTLGNRKKWRALTFWDPVAKRLPKVIPTAVSGLTRCKFACLYEWIEPKETEFVSKPWSCCTCSLIG